MELQANERDSSSDLDLLDFDDVVLMSCYPGCHSELCLTWLSHYTMYMPIYDLNDHMLMPQESYLDHTLTSCECHRCRRTVCSAYPSRLFSQAT